MPTVVDELLAKSEEEWSEEEIAILNRVSGVLMAKVYDKLEQGKHPDEIIESLLTLQSKKEGKVLDAKREQIRKKKEEKEVARARKPSMKQPKQEPTKLVGKAGGSGGNFAGMAYLQALKDDQSGGGNTKRRRESLEFLDGRVKKVAADYDKEDEPEPERVKSKGGWKGGASADAGDEAAPSGGSKAAGGGSSAGPAAAGGAAAGGKSGGGGGGGAAGGGDSAAADEVASEESDDDTPKRRGKVKRGKKKDKDGGVASDDDDEGYGGADGSGDKAAGRRKDKTKETDADLLAAMHKRQRMGYNGDEADGSDEDGAAAAGPDGGPPVDLDESNMDGDPTGKPSNRPTPTDRPGEGGSPDDNVKGMKKKRPMGAAPDGDEDLSDLDSEELERQLEAEAEAELAAELEDEDLDLMDDDLDEDEIARMAEAELEMEEAGEFDDLDDEEFDINSDDISLDEEDLKALNSAELSPEEQQWLDDETERLEPELVDEEDDMEMKGKDDPKRNKIEDMEWEPESDPESGEDNNPGDEPEPPPEEKPTDNPRAPGDEGQGDEDDPPEELKDEPEEPEFDHEIDIDDIDHPGWLIPHFSVTKYDPKARWSPNLKRIWAIDMARKLHMNMDTKGKVKKPHPAGKLLVIEKNIMKHNMAKLMFFDASHAYELVYQHGTDRERMYECTSALRQFRVWCPDLCRKGIENSNTRITTHGKVVDVDVGKTKVKKKLEQEVNINASRKGTERVKLWTGTFNLGGNRPPSFEQLEEWIPRSGYDLYAITVQDAHYRKDENEWYRYLARYMGKGHIILAQMTVWDVCLCVIARKGILTKVANVEGFTKTTKDIATHGPRGGCAIAIKYHETSLCFLAVHLPDGVERNKQRWTVMKEIWDDLRIANLWTDLFQQFHHFFIMGDLNYQVEMPFDEALKCVKDKDWKKLTSMDQLKDQMETEGILHGCEEQPINFAPTAWVKPGTDGEYIQGKSKRSLNTPSYADRIIWKNNPAGHDFLPKGYGMTNKVYTSNHFPVWATFDIDCQRPYISVFGFDVTPVQFRFESLTAELPLVLKNPLCQMYGHEVDKPQYSKAGALKKTDKPSWTKETLPLMYPMIHHRDLLETQHFLIMMRDGTEKSSALRGTAVLFIKEAVTNPGKSIPFDLDLCFRGKKIGTVKGAYHMEDAPQTKFV